MLGDKRQGFGAHVDLSGSRYEGDWLDDKYDGWGRKVSAYDMQHSVMG